MPVMLEGAKRSEIQAFQPDSLGSIVLGLNLRAPGAPKEELEELAQGIAAKGQIQPGLVRRDHQGRAVLVAGFRRLAAIRLINRDPGRFGLAGPLPFLASVRTITEEEAIDYNLEENIARKELSPLDLAHAIRELEKLQWDTKRIGERLRLSPARITQLLSLLELPAEIRTRVHRGQLSEVAGRSLRNLPKEQIAAIVAKHDEKAGGTSADVVRAAGEARRERGERRARTPKEIRAALAASDSSQAKVLLLWIDGEPGVEFSQAELGDVTSTATDRMLSEKFCGGGAKP